jgi:hypothetical protein
MKTRKTTERGTTRTASDVQPGSPGIVPLHGADREKTKQDTSILKPRPVLQAVALTHDLIAARARTIWLERGCSSGQDDENWRDAETRLRTEMGIG